MEQKRSRLRRRDEGRVRKHAHPLATKQRLGKEEKEERRKEKEERRKKKGERRKEKEGRRKEGGRVGRTGGRGRRGIYNYKILEGKEGD